MRIEKGIPSENQIKEIQSLTVESGFDKRLLGMALDLEVNQGVGIFISRKRAIDKRPNQSITRMEENAWNAEYDRVQYETDRKNLEQVFNSTKDSNPSFTLEPISYTAGPRNSR